MIVRMVSFPYKIERGGLICLRIVFDNMPFFDGHNSTCVIIGLKNLRDFFCILNFFYPHDT